jgi:phage terminase small subunit
MERFCQEMSIDGDRARAYKAAGYKTSSDSSAYAAASRLMLQPKIVRRIQELNLAKAERTQITADRLLHEVACVAFGSLKDVIKGGVGVSEDQIDAPTRGVYLRSVEEIPENAWPAVKSIRYSYTQNAQGEAEILSVVMHNKTPALKMLAENMGLLSDLDAAKQVFKRYGFRMIEEGNDYRFVDTYTEGDSDDDSLLDGDDSLLDEVDI